jgi:toxin ParE1/3/4
MGRLRPEYAPGLRSFVVDDYVVLYQVVEATIEIAHVLHGSRDIDTLLKDPTDTD